MTKKKKINKFNGVLIFVIVSTFMYFIVSGIADIFTIKGLFSSPYYKIGAGVVGIVVLSILGWRKRFN